MPITGIDISKSWFDYSCSQSQKAQRLDNKLEGWQQFIEEAGSPEDLHIVMEASGPYFLPFACWLYEQNITVSVVNPLVIRRYSQMQLTRVKTDAKDAELIAAYGRDQCPEAWRPPAGVARQLRQLMSLRDGLLVQKNKLSNQQEAFSLDPKADPLAEEIIDQQLKQIEFNLSRISRRTEKLAESHYQDCLQALLTIPGIGKKTAILLICITDGFTRFESARKLAAYAGLCPRVWQSGSSVKGRGSICKLGCPELRKLLYMCAWSAKRYNPACKQMHERLKAKGKPPKVINVAIAHKLLRQAFGVGSKQEPFNEKLAMAA
jgi:transposase